MQSILSFLSNYFANVPGQVQQRRWTVLLAFLAATAICFYGITKLKFDFTIEGWLEQDDAAFVAYNQFHDQFGSDDGVVIVYKPKDGNVFSEASLRTVKQIRDDLVRYRAGLKAGEQSALDHIVEVNSLVNAVVLSVTDDVLASKALVGDKIPNTPEGLAAVRRTAEAQRDFPLKYFSRDGKLGVLYIKTDFGAIPIAADSQAGGKVNIDMKAGADTGATARFMPTDMADYVALNAELNKILNKPAYLAQFAYYKIGNTVDSENQVNMGKEMGLLYLAAIVIMLTCLYFIFRSLAGVIWPFLIIIVSTIWTLGISGLLGLPASAFVVLTVLLILTIGMADSIHIMSGYLYFRHEGHDSLSSIKAAYEKAGLPCLLTAITSIIGIMSLNISNLVPVNNFAIMSSLGVGIAFFLTFYLLPILLELYPPAPKPRKASARRIVPDMVGALQRNLEKVVPAVAKRPLTVMVPFFVVFAVSLYGASQVKVDISILDQYAKTSNFYQSIALLDDQLAGSSRISLFVDLKADNGFQDPAVLKVVDALQRKLETRYSRYVVKTSSIVDVVKDASQKQNEGRADMYAIPSDANTLSQTLFMFNTADPDEREKLVSENYRKANISISLRTYGSNAYVDVFAQMKQDIAASLAVIRKDYPQAAISITGLFAMGMTTADYLVVNELQSFGLSVLVISLILFLIFGSVKAGLVSLLPNLVPSFLVLGLLGLFGIPLDFYTMMLAPVVVGISVDDTIHFMAHYRSAVQVDGNIVRALQDTVKECGQAVVFTSLILGLGFGVMAVASTPGFANLGKFGFLSIMSGLICELFLTPALIIVCKLRFSAPAPAILRAAPTIQVP
jgi:predicted RND superfamily exporter protein